MKEPNPSFLKRLEEAAKGTFWEYVGGKLERLSDEEVHVTLQAKRHHLNGIGILNGGVHASLLDNAMGIAAMAARPAEKVVTSALHLHYLAPVKLELIHVRAKVLHETRSMITTEGRLTGEDGRLCAYATASYRIFYSYSDKAGDRDGK